MSGDRRSYIIEQYLQIVCHDQESALRLRKKFIRWFLDDTDREEKDLAMRLFFEQRNSSEQHEPLSEEQLMRMFQEMGFQPDVRPLQRTLRARRLLRPFRRIAAVVALIFVLSGSVWWGYQWYRSERIRPLAEHPHTVSSGMGEVKQLVLPDGTEVTLNENSTLTYHAYRNASLEGEAFFKVTPDKRPFTVQAVDLEVTVLGTEFNLCVYREQAVSTVTLYEGAVRVENNQVEYTLSPGHELVYNAGTQKTRIDEIPLQQEANQPAWISAALNFEGRSLSDIFRSVERYYGVRIEYDSTMMSSGNYSFRLLGGESLEMVLTVLQQMSGTFDYRIEQDRVLIEARN